MGSDSSQGEDRASQGHDDARYRSMLAAMAEGVVFQDAGGRIVFCNPSAERILGLPAAQMMGRASTDPVWQAIRENGSPFPGEEHPAIVTLRTGQPCRDVVMGLQRPDGAVTWLSINSEPLHRQGEPLPYSVVTTFNDVTRQRQSELALKHSEALYRTLVENQGEGSGIVDVKERFLFANPTGEAIFGVPAGTLAGRSLFEFVSEEGSAFIQAQTRIRVRGERSEYELEIRRESDGAQRTLLISATPQFGEDGKVSATFGVFRDITDRKRVETALQESEARLRLTFDQAPIGAAMVGLDYRFVRVNDAFCRFLGYRPEELIGLPVPDITFPDHRDADREHAERLAEGRLDRYQLEKRYVRKDGTLVWGHVTVSLVRDASGRGLYFMSMVEDVTERKRAEEEREKLQLQLLHAQKMESVGRLAGGVAHDFNNLLTVINGYSTLALKRLGEQDPLSEIIREIENAGEAAAALVRQLLAFGRKQLLHKELVDLNVMLGGMTKTLLPLLGEHIEIHAHLRPALSCVLADRHQLEQVIMNLAVNARDAMPRGGLLTIETDEVVCGPYCRHCVSPIGAGHYVCVTVRDSGVGMDEQTRQHLFEPFYSTKPASHGTGLGLATVHGVILQSGGHIDVESRPGKGTAFYIYLPVAPPVDVSTTVAELAPGPAVHASDNGKILLVEDQPEVRRLAVGVLRQCGYGVLEAGSAEEALAHPDAGQVDLLLTDVVLPKMSGWELATEVRTRQPRTKVLFMSGYSEEALKGHAGEIGAASLIQKPFAPAVLAEKVREVLAVAAPGQDSPARVD